LTTDSKWAENNNNEISSCSNIDAMILVKVRSVKYEKCNFKYITILRIGLIKIGQQQSGG